MSYKFTVILQQEDDWYVSTCLENDVASQGKTINEAIENLKEAIELYYEDNDKPNEIMPTFVTTVEVVF